jgi:D-alanyl-D-alanine carboxypeptidase
MTTMRVLMLGLAVAMLLTEAPPSAQAPARAATSATAAATVPDTPAAKQFMAWLDAFNSGDRARLQKYLEENRTDGASNLGPMMGMREQTGGFELRRPLTSTPTRFAALVQERDSDQFGELALEVDPAPPHKFGRIEMRPVPRPPDFPLARLSEQDALAALKTNVERSVAADRFAGAVAIGKHGRSLFSAAYGQADREKAIANTLDTKFRIGSMNKMFTAVATLQLVQAGKIKLTDTLGTYLTDYGNKDVASKVTIHHLLTHTGGTGDIFGPQFTAHRTELRTLTDYVTLYGTRALEFEPGSRWAYSNYGFMLLGVVIERVSGKSYYDDLRERIFVPTGMTATDSEPEDTAVPNRSVGYTKMGGSPSWRPNTDSLPYRGTSAGGGYSTVGDLLRFADALLTHKLLDAKHTELLYTGKVDTPRGSAKYAYGFQDQVDGDARWVGHGGGAPGMNGELIIYPRSGYAVAVLANLDPPAASRVAQFVSNRLPL